MNDWKERLRGKLEPILEMRDPRPKLSAYHDMPYAIFWYPPDVEFELRKELELLVTRLSQKGKVITTISLAECLDAALREHAPWEKLAEAERTLGVSAAIDTVHEVLATYCPLVDLDDLFDPTVDGVCEERLDLGFGHESLHFHVR